MNKPYSIKVINYKFEIHKTALNSIIFGNLLLLLGFLFGKPNIIFTNHLSQFCLLSASFIFITKLFYHWKNPNINLFIIFIYLSFYLFEVILFGIPESIIQLSSTMSKGILFDFILIIIPYLYSGLRILLVIPLIQIYFTSKKLKTYEAIQNSTKK